MDLQNISYTGKFIMAANIDDDVASKELLQIIQTGEIQAPLKGGEGDTSKRTLTSLILRPALKQPSALSEENRDCDSPSTEPVIMTVQAVVHHALDWSPMESEDTIPSAMTKPSSDKQQKNDSGFVEEYMNL